MVIVFTGCLKSQVDVSAEAKPGPASSGSLTTKEPTEPPLALVEGRVDGGRAVLPLPASSADVINCQVEYQDGLKSIMQLDVETHAPLSESFTQWVVDFTYMNDEAESSRVPSAIYVYKNNGGTRSDKFDLYTLKEVDPGGQTVRYLDSSGRLRLIPRGYFNIDNSLSLKEPPLKISPKDEGVMRACSPLAPPNEQEEYRTFRVRYLGYGFESRMVVEVATGAPMREVFPFWWEVNYLYVNTKDREDHVPTTIIIYHNTSYDTKGAQLARYDKMFVDPDGQTVHYKDLSGKEKQVEKAYFDVMPEPPLETTQ